VLSSSVRKRQRVRVRLRRVLEKAMNEKKKMKSDEFVFVVSEK
jgi:hypothetical protein